MSEVFEKEITQIESIDEEVSKIIKDMGHIWKSCSEKLKTDNICFICKKDLGEEQFNVIKVPDNKCEKGLFILAAICDGCR